MYFNVLCKMINKNILQKKTFKSIDRRGLAARLRTVRRKKIYYNLLAYYLSRTFGCGSVGRVVASNCRGPRFEFSHGQISIKSTYLLSTVMK